MKEWLGTENVPLVGAVLIVGVVGIIGILDTIGIMGALTIVNVIGLLDNVVGMFYLYNRLNGY